MAEKGVRWFIRFVTDPESRAKVLRDNEATAREASDDWKRTGTKAGDDLEQGLRKGSREGTAAAKREGGKITAFFKSQFAQLAATFAAIFGVAAIGRFIGDVVKLGVAGGETASKFSTTFGHMRGEMEEFLSTFSTMAGLSMREGQDAAATTAAMARGMGFTTEAATDLSKQVLQTAGDLTSFNDVPIEETLRAVRSAIVGEREALKTLGIVVQEKMVQDRAMEQTGKKNAEALTLQEKAAATLSLIYEGMGPAAGDLVRTQDSLANATRATGASWRTFKEVLGETIVSGGAAGSVVISLRDTVISLTNWVRANGDQIRTWSAGVITSLVAVFRTLTNLGKFFKNSIEIAANTIEMILTGIVISVEWTFNKVVDGVNWLIRKANEAIPDEWDIPEIKFKATFAEDAKKNFREARFELAKNEEQARSALANIGDAWMDVYDAVKQANAATNDTLADTSEGAKEAVEDMNKLKIATLDAMNIHPRLEGKGKVAINKDVSGMVVKEVGPMAGGALEQRQVFAANLEAMTDLIMSETQLWQNAFGAVAGGMEQAFGNAFSMLFEDMTDLGGFVEELARGMAVALISGVAQFASAKVAENVAMAFENFAAASAAAAQAVFYPPAAFAAGAFTAAAKGHLVSAAKWAVVAGGASAAAGAVAGGGSGGGGGRARGGTGVDVTREAAREEKKGPDIIVYLNPFDERSPRMQDKVGEAARMYQERYGGNMIFKSGEG